MTNLIQQLIAQSIHHLENNSQAQAENLLLRVLQIEPKNLPALEILGLSKAKSGNYPDAIGHLKKAVKINSKNPSTLFNLARALSDNGNYLESMAFFEKSLQLNRKDLPCLISYAMTLEHLKKFDKALAIYEEILSGNINLADIWLQKALCLKLLQEYDLSLEAYTKAIELKGDYPEAHIGKGNIFMELEEYEKAAFEYERAISIRPNYAEGYSNLGVALEKLARFDDAIKCFEEAAKLNPGYVGAYLNKSRVVKALGDMDAAFALLEKAIAIDPLCAEAHYEMGSIALKKMSFDLGWEKYEWRWILPNLPKQEMPNKPLWTGGEPKNRLLIWGEQGIGDQTLFSSVFKELEGFDKKIIISLNKKLIPIYKRTFPKFEFRDLADPVSINEFDEHIPIGSLAKYFRKNVQDFEKTNFPYLADDPSRTTKLRDQLHEPKKMICGLACNSTNKMLASDKNFPISMLSPLLQLEQFKFLNLQYGEAGEKLLELGQANNTQVHHFPDIDLFDDLDSVLSLVNACDVVLSSSNTIAHLAGALGKRTILIVPYETGKFWYWHEINHHSLWYPSIRVFTQNKQGDWSDVMSEVFDFMGSLSFDR